MIKSQLITDQSQKKAVPDKKRQPLLFKFQLINYFQTSFQYQFSV